MSSEFEYEKVAVEKASVEEEALKIQAIAEAKKQVKECCNGGASSISEGGKEANLNRQSSRKKLLIYMQSYLKVSPL